MDNAMPPKHAPTAPEPAGVDPRVCRERLARLIAEESGALDELAQHLEREHALLLAQDAAGLEAAIRSRRGCVARIIRADEERNALCRQLRFTADPQGLERLVRWCDPDGTLATGWKACAAAAAQCRTLNDRNGAFVGARLKHVQERLAALLGSRREPVTYGRRGGYEVSAAGRVIKTEV